jgi:GNAT superfamily N-acetyltransferase
MREAFTVREARAADIEPLTALIARSVRELSRGYYDERQIESSIVHVFGVDSQLVADGTYYVVEAEGAPVACGGWSRRATLYGGDQHKSAEDALLDPKVDPARIRAFFVDPSFARRGIGRLLLEHCARIAAAEGFSRIELAATLPGEPMYARLGFTELRRFDVELPDGVRLPIVQMARDL